MDLAALTSDLLFSSVILFIQVCCILPAVFQISGLLPNGRGRATLDGDSGEKLRCLIFMVF